MKDHFHGNTKNILIQTTQTDEFSQVPVYIT